MEGDFMSFPDKPVLTPFSFTRGEQGSTNRSDFFHEPPTAQQNPSADEGQASSTLPFAAYQDVKLVNPSKASKSLEPPDDMETITASMKKVSVKEVVTTTFFTPAPEKDNEVNALTEMHK